MSPLEKVVRPITLAHLRQLAESGYGDLIKAVVDVRRRIMVVGGELHSDEEQVLLDDGSRQEDLWGINIYPDEESDELVEYDSMINVRPAQGNRSRGVEDTKLRGTIRTIVEELLQP